MRRSAAGQFYGVGIDFASPVTAAETAGIDPDWEQLSADKNKLELFNDILRATAGDRENYQIDLAIAVRLPGSGGIPVKDAAQLLNKLCCHRVKLALDIHPHELLAAPVEWEKLLANFRFNTSCVRFCYPSELGNKLLYQHIAPIIEVLKKLKQECFIYLAPSGKADLEEWRTVDYVRYWHFPAQNITGIPVNTGFVLFQYVNTTETTTVTNADGSVTTIEGTAKNKEVHRPITFIQE